MFKDKVNILKKTKYILEPSEILLGDGLVQATT